MPKKRKNAKPMLGSYNVRKGWSLSQFMLAMLMNIGYLLATPRVAPPGQFLGYSPNEWLGQEIVLHLIILIYNNKYTFNLD